MQCGKCGEQVDEAKAFCPGCGNAFVEEEKRTTVSDFDRSNETVQLGSTMYNQLLSDMGLNIPKAADKSVSVPEAVAEKPAAPPAAAPPEAAQPAAKPSSHVKWLIIGAVVVLGLVVLVILAALVILFMLWPRFA
jgi:hypothetical protein